MSSQLVNLNVGFGNKAIGDAIKAQVDKFCFVGPAYAAESRAKTRPQNSQARSECHRGFR